MPGRDGTGPRRQGAFTGRGISTENEPRVGTGNGARSGAGYGRGNAPGASFGLGLGLGYGCRKIQEQRCSVEADQATLSQEKAVLQRRLERVTDQLNRLSNKDK